ncbi:HAMP domain-containing histidine kinase [Methyloligella sp. GL2]|nr:HAMP domain-containing histidine kinase [Methyloligella sp. GL2]
MLAEVLVFVPSVSNFRHQWLVDRLAAAEIAALAAEAAPNGEVPMSLRDELLMNAGVLAVLLRRPNARKLVLNMTAPRVIDATYDLRTRSWPMMIAETMALYFQSDDRVIRVIGDPGMADGDTMMVVMEEGPLRAAVIRYSLDILGLSILISVITGTLVYLALIWLLVRPMMRLTRNIVNFRDDPESPSSIIRPSNRKDEIGQAEHTLAAMEHELANTLGQKRRLAALGLGVSKVNHDLRNMLSSAQLLSDRLGAVEDPTVQRVLPKLLASLERAIRLCARTLDYGQAEEAAPERERLALRPLVVEIGESLGLPRAGTVDWSIDVPDDLEVDADRDQLFRVLSNLAKNALQAIETANGGTGAGKGANKGAISVRAWRDGESSVIELADTGPGVSERAAAHLFQPFQSVARKGGAGLGLAIAAELVQAHGGSIELTGNEGGATFQVAIPDYVAGGKAGRRAA